MSEKRIYRVKVEFTVEHLTDSKAWEAVCDAIDLIEPNKHPDILDVEMGSISDITDEVN